MKFGIFIPNYGSYASRKTIEKIAFNAEKLEFDSIWVSDHIIVPKKFSKLFSNVYEPIATLSYLAAKTENLILGTSVVVLPLRDPVLFAKQIATIDQLTDCEIYLGLGSGWLKEEFDFLGKNFKERGKIMDDEIIMIKNLLTNNVIKINNEEYYFSPISKKRNGPPMLIGGNSRRAMERAAKIAEGWHPIRLKPKEIEKGIRIMQKYSVQRKIVIPRVSIMFKGQNRLQTDNVLASSSRQIMEEFEELNKLGINHIVIDFPVEQQPEKYVEDMKTVKNLTSSF
jgi:probable F420-dependent oxidoreductase